MQFTPFGSSLLYTKQLKASRNCSPQGPCAIPPRQGQSQLISPVSSLNAPSSDASSSNAPGPDCDCSVEGAIGAAEGEAAGADCTSRDNEGWRAGNVGEEMSVCDSDGDPEGTSAEAEALRRCLDSAIASKVGNFASCGTS